MPIIRRGRFLELKIFLDAFIGNTGYFVRNTSVFFSWNVSSFSIPYAWFYSLVLYTYAWKSFIHLFVQYLYPQCSRILQWTKPDKKHCHHGAYFLTYIECQMMTRTRRKIEQRRRGMPGCSVDMCPYLSHTGWETQHKCSLLIFFQKSLYWAHRTLLTHRFLLL